jgi:hypothetical protein
MGEHLNPKLDVQTRKKFIKHLLNDVEALEQMIREGQIEKGISRIGAEQEFCLVNQNWRPSTDSHLVLEDLNDRHFTTELARYNLEINLDPIELDAEALSRMERQLIDLMKKANASARKHDLQTILTGILPTISKDELGLDFMTPNPRYSALNERLKELRGRDFELKIRGVDELSLVHDSVLFEACNTSFQMHLQIDPDDFIANYNWAQAIAGPVLGICANSPLLLGRELWSETRIALFQQSIDTRNSSYALKEQQARVSFGNDWAKGSIADIYREEIATYKIILTRDIEQDALEELRQNRIPKLSALGLHNGTIYRWNRACYGEANGIAHVRIENRYIPAGPSIADEMANFAFWIGLMKGRPIEFDDMASAMDFREAKENFIKTARTGKSSVLSWQGELISVRDLIVQRLLPIARSGLLSCGIPEIEINRHLGVIEARAAGKTGAQWIIYNYRKLRKTFKRDEALLLLTKSMHENAETNLPVHTWKDIDSALQNLDFAQRVRHVMSTQLFTVRSDDSADLATSIMR